MSILSARLKVLQDAKEAYELDYIVMRSGFIYRKATVLTHDDDGLLISQEHYPETFINASEIASARINRL